MTAPPNNPVVLNDGREQLATNSPCIRRTLRALVIGQSAGDLLAAAGALLLLRPEWWAPLLIILVIAVMALITRAQQRLVAHLAIHTFKAGLQEAKPLALPDAFFKELFEKLGQGQEDLSRGARDRAQETPDHVEDPEPTRPSGR